MLGGEKKGRVEARKTIDAAKRMFRARLAGGDRGRGQTLEGARRER